MNAVQPEGGVLKTEVPGRNRTGHGGTIHAVLKQRGQSHGQVIDFSANINPLGPPEWLRPLISRELDSVLHYPDPEYPELIEAISTFYKVDPGCVIPSNGSTDLLYLLPRILECKRALVPVPSYIDYVKAVQLAGLDVEEFLLREEDDFKLDLVRLSSEICPGDLVIFASPNNPTGAYIESSAICRLAMDFPEATFLIDEAFLDFVQTGECIGARLPNLLTLNSMTKFYGVPGLRLGFGVFPHEIAEQVRESLPPWTLNSLAQAFGVECLRDFEYHQRSRDEVVHLRQLLVTHLENFDQLKVFPSKGNYLMIKLENGLTSPVLAAQLLEHGILIRCCDNYSGLDDRYFRIAVRTEVENYQLLEALTTVLDSGHKKYPQRTRKTPAIMFQGTSSNAGKSVLTAALCRILLQDGVRVAPFKAQNMSLNSFVTRNGEEMGRAQVVQAQAAKLDPDVRMNPILLKPNSDTGSQIIVNGFPVGNMSVLDYGRYKPKAWEAVCKSYDSLSDEYDAVVLEGAGSPGEVNLKAEDIVNMRMAAYAEAPVLLVGDIDRGGVYASYVGTMEVLSAWERELVAGFVINRFRGQASLLDSAHKYLVDHTGRHSFGVVPYLSDLGLPEEDSVSFKAGLFNRKAKSEEFIDIALINFPHISNFTDVEPFLAEPDVSLRVVDSVEALGNPDVIILPGSKNVIGDLRFLEQKGFSQLLKALGTQKKCEIVGICGGYQVLGKRIDDPHGIESNSKTIEAIGLLDITTELKEKKTLTRQEGTHIESGATVFGYEIHHGISESVLAPVLRFNDGRSCGSMIETGRVWGSYLHGIFDSDSFRRWFIDSIRERKGLQPVKQIMAPYDLESAFDRLADTVRSSLDMDRIYSLLKL